MGFCGTIPYGEIMVIDALREWRGKIGDPELKERVVGLMNYFKPSFHPDQSNSEELLDKLERKLFSEGGILNTYITKVV